MSEATAFMRLMADVRAGVPEAAAELVRCYQPRLLRAVRRALCREMRTLFDSTDFTQAA